MEEGATSVTKPAALSSCVCVGHLPAPKGVFVCHRFAFCSSVKSEMKMNTENETEKCYSVLPALVAEHLEGGLTLFWTLARSEIVETRFPSDRFLNIVTFFVSFAFWKLWGWKPFGRLCRGFRIC